MAEFKSYRSFLDFTESIRREWRFVRSLEQQEFLSTVLASSLNRREQIAEGTFVWRAQGGHDWLSDDGEDNMCPFPPERMKPLPYQMNSEKLVFYRRRKTACHALNSCCRSANP